MVDVEAADDGRELEEPAVTEGEEHRESSASEALDVSEVNEEWRVAAGMIDSDAIGLDSLSSGEAVEASGVSSATLAGALDAATLIAEEARDEGMKMCCSGQEGGRTGCIWRVLPNRHGERWKESVCNDEGKLQAFSPVAVLLDRWWRWWRWSSSVISVVRC